MVTPLEARRGEGCLPAQRGVQVRAGRRLLRRSKEVGATGKSPDGVVVLARGAGIEVVEIWQGCSLLEGVKGDAMSPLGCLRRLSLPKADTRDRE